MVMQFNVKKRDGPARFGELVIDDKKVVTPNLFFIKNSRFKSPDFADLVVTNQDIKTEKPSLRIVGSIFLPLKGKRKDEMQISRCLTYPKDLPYELHRSSIKSLKKEKSTCYIIP